MQANWCAQMRNVSVVLLMLTSTGTMVEVDYSIEIC